MFAGKLEWFDQNKGDGFIDEMGAVMDILNIFDTYTEDYSALALIKTVLVKSEYTALKENVLLIPADNREYNRWLLRHLRDNVDQTFILSLMGGQCINVPGQPCTVRNGLPGDNMEYYCQ